MPFGCRVNVHNSVPVGPTWHLTTSFKGVCEHAVISPYLPFCLPRFQLSAVTIVWKLEAGVLPPDELSGGQSQHLTTSQCLRRSRPLISLRQHAVISGRPEKGEDPTVRDFQRETDHTPITGITVQCYNCCILLLLFASHRASVTHYTLHFMVSM